MKTKELQFKNIAGIMLSVAPRSLFTQCFKNPENNRVFYEMVCSRACLNHKSLDVMRSFEVAKKQAREVKK